MWNSIVFVGLTGKIVSFRDDHQDTLNVTVFANVEPDDYYNDLHVHRGGGKDGGCFLNRTLLQGGLIHQYDIQDAFPASPVEPSAEVDVSATVGSDGITSQWNLFLVCPRVAIISFMSWALMCFLVRMLFLAILFRI